MGMPVNSYSLLQTIANGGEIWEERTIANALKPFNRFAFILHDPEQHPGFHHHLEEIFDRLGYVTGLINAESLQQVLTTLNFLNHKGYFKNNYRIKRYYRDG